MTQPVTRTALMLMAGGAVMALAMPAAAQVFRPNFPIRLPQAQAQAAPAKAADDTPTATAPEAAPAAPSLKPVAVESRPLADLPAARVAPEPEAVAEQPPPPVVRLAQRSRARSPATPPPAAASEGASGKLVSVAGAPATYKVRKHDTVSEVADKLGVTVAELKKLNRLKSSTIRAGQTMKGPASGSAKAYLVAHGDTLYAVADRFNVTAEALREANGLKRGAAVRSGQKLRLPAGYRDLGPTAVAEADEAPTPARRGRTTPRVETPRVETPDDETSDAYRSITTRSVTGRVVEMAGGAATHRVRKGDTLEEIADDLGISVSELKKLNKLKGSVIRPGQVLKGPTTTAKAYVAASGDTVATVARRFSVSADALRDANGLKRNAAIRPGQRLKLPSGFRDRGAITTTTRVVVPTAEPPPMERTPERAPPVERPAPVRTAPAQPEPPAVLPSRPQPYSPSGSYPPRIYRPPVTTPTPRYTPPSTTSSAPVAAPIATPPPSDAQISSMGRGRFVWPVRGDVLASFGPKAGGTRNDGVNIRGAAGDPVRAAAGGDVVYAGDQVPGFGNLVLIKHPDGWVTAYGHLSRVEVKMQQKVSQGQQIGLVGSTGGVAEPQLHFEVRYGAPGERAKPIDPNLVLPR